MEKYGKSSSALIKLKKGFFEENQLYLEKAKRWAKLYSSQPVRLTCMNCGNGLGDAVFTKLGVAYTFCSRCGHLNGLHEDTDEYCNELYTADGGKLYAVNYSSEDRDAFKSRVSSIYLPKVAFLLDGLKERGENPRELSYVELGAGSGYMQSALSTSGIRKTCGYEVSRVQVDFGNMMIGETLLHKHSPSELMEIVNAVDADVVCMIGVLEHLQQPRKVLESITNNSSINNLFFSVPMMSPCVFFEMVFPQIMPRHLTGGHTHLYTESSLRYMVEEFNLDIIAQWWFGTDMVDLYRSILVSLQNSGATVGASDYWVDMFSPLIDDMQLVLDKAKVSSEVHVLCKIRRE